MFIDYRRAGLPLIIFFFIGGLCLNTTNLKAQQNPGDSVLTEATIENVVAYALKNQPVISQALADEQIANYQVKSKLAEWLPQVNFNYLYQHNFQLSANVIGGNLVKFGVNNTSAFQFTLNQTIFNRDVLLAKRSGRDVLIQAKQQTEAERIDLAANVAKAFYDVLATERQISVSAENVIRLERSLYDSKAQYEAGVVDKTDYKRAMISLNNTSAQKRLYEEQAKAKRMYLKSLMNYPENAELKLVFDSAKLVDDIALDTLQIINYATRIEYQQLETQKRLLEANLQYNKWSFIPSVSANGAYFLNYFNDEFSKLYYKSVPNSYAGLTLSFPIFQGGKRRYDIRQAEWQLRRTEYGLEGLKDVISSEYSSALANYKYSLNNFYTLKENVVLAKEVYDVIDLQYRSGVKAYIEVLVAEVELRSAQINYFDALYQVLSSKIDVMRALGLLKY